MLILILINVQFLQIVVFNFEKSLNDQKHSSSDSHQHMNKSPSPSKIPHSSPYRIFPLQ